MKFIFLLFIFYTFNCLPDLTADKGLKSKKDAQNECLLYSLLYTDAINNGRDPKNMGLIVLSACNDYFYYDQND